MYGSAHKAQPACCRIVTVGVLSKEDDAIEEYALAVVSAGQRKYGVRGRKLPLGLEKSAPGRLGGIDKAPVCD